MKDVTPSPSQPMKIIIIEFDKDKINIEIINKTTQIKKPKKFISFFI